MPNVKLLTGRAGIANGQPFAQQAGETIEVSTEEASRLIEAGQAVPVKKQRRTATRKPTETRADALETEDGPGERAD